MNSNAIQKDQLGNGKLAWYCRSVPVITNRQFPGGLKD